MIRRSPPTDGGCSVRPLDRLNELELPTRGPPGQLGHGSRVVGFRLENRSSFGAEVLIRPLLSRFDLDEARRASSPQRNDIDRPLRSRGAERPPSRLTQDLANVALALVAASIHSSLLARFGTNQTRKAPTTPIAAAMIVCAVGSLTASTTRAAAAIAATTALR